MIQKRIPTAHIIRVALIILISIVAVFPFLWMLSNSFNSAQNIFKLPPSLIPDLLFKENMFENYVQVITEFNFGRYALNSLFVSSMAAIGQMFICSLAGFAFAMMRFKGRNLVFSALLLTLMVPVQVTIIPEYFLMMKLNWIDTYLPLIVPSFLAGAFGTFMLKEFFEQVPDAIFDAGVIDGANAFTMYKDVYAPQSVTPTVTLFIIAFMNSWNDLLRAMLYITTDSLQTVTLALMQFQGQYEAKWNLLLTGSVLSVLPLVILFIVCQRFIIENSMSSAVKG